MDMSHILSVVTYNYTTHGGECTGTPLIELNKSDNGGVQFERVLS